MKKTELITNSDGSIFHLNLKPEDISDKIVIVGDPGRVDMLSTMLHDIRVRKENREFRTVTGTYQNSEISIISSGIGTDNIDIVLNELDALVNIDLKTGEIKDDAASLTIIRIGTSGALRREIPAGSCLMTETAIGFDGLLHFYDVRKHFLGQPHISLRPNQSLVTEEYGKYRQHTIYVCSGFYLAHERMDGTSMPQVVCPRTVIPAQMWYSALLQNFFEPVVDIAFIQGKS